tara:strand:+ start:98 stop:292 length:195 start_codon:yes stop_codon:yes gene_type:complete
MKSIEEQFKDVQREADSDFDKAIKNQASIDATNKILKEADKALIEDFMKGLIHYIYNQRAKKRK